MTPSSLTSYHLRGAAASSFISAVFAFAWGLNGSLVLPGGWRFVALGLTVLLTLALAWFALRCYRDAGRFPAGSVRRRPTLLLQCLTGSPSSPCLSRCLARADFSH